MLRSICFCLVIVVCLPAYSQEGPKNSAPFGLSWGMSVADVKALAVDLTEVPENQEYGTAFHATKLPKMISDAESVFLFFTDDKLWRIAAASRHFGNDPGGTAVVSRYDELLKALSEKYGKGKSVHNRRESSRAEYFLMHINGGESQWFTDFNTNEVFVQLAIGATDMSTGIWRLIVENKRLRVEFEAAKHAREKNAL